MNNKLPKIDLSILKKLVEHLESGIAEAETIREGETPDQGDYIVAMSKVAGLAAGVSQEGTMLVGDIHALIKMSQQPLPKTPDFLEKLLGGIKGNNGTSN